MQTPTKASGRSSLAAWEVESSGNSAVVRLSGEIDLSATAPADGLLSALTDALDSEAVVTCDLSGVTFLDSSGVHLLVKLADEVGRRAGRFFIARPQESARRVLDIVGASSLFEVID